MSALRNASTSSRLVLILLFLVAMIVGALLSYMFVMGTFYLVPEKTSIAVTNVAFSAQNAMVFNATILNPSYSPSSATITQIAVITKDNTLYITSIVDPPRPYTIKPGETKTFTCYWDWSNHIGEIVRIAVSIAEKQASGATFQAETPIMNLMISEVYFNSTVSTTHFNVTIQNSRLSATYVNITDITVAAEDFSGIIENTSPPLPFTLYNDTSITFTCPWDWTDRQGEEVTITVRTLQGYKASRTLTTPPPLVNLSITDVLFNITDTTHFNVTVQNSELSTIYVDITEINVTVGNETREILTVEPPSTPPYRLYPNSSVTFLCSWNWTDYQGQNVTITVYTLKGYRASRTTTIPTSSVSSSLQILGMALQGIIRSKGQAKPIRFEPSFGTGQNRLKLKTNLTRCYKALQQG